MAFSSSPFKSFFFRETGIGCLLNITIKSETEINIDTHFFALNHSFPNNLGSRGITRSSARKRPFSLNNRRRASNPLNLPFNFSIPTTLEINLMLLASRRSLYSRWGSFVIKHTAVSRGSTRGCSRGLR